MGARTRSPPQSGGRCEFSPRGVGVQQNPQGGPQGWYSQRLMAKLPPEYSQQEPCPLSALFPVSSCPKSWSSFLRSRGAFGEKQVSPAMTRMIRVAWRVRSPLADYRPCALFLGRGEAGGQGWDGGLETFYHHLCCDKTHTHTFCSHLLLERPVQMAGLLQVLSCPCICPGQLSPVFS